MKPVDTFLELEYGRRALTLDLCRIGNYTVLDKERGRWPDKCTLVEEALKTPMGSPRLSEIVKKGERVCIVVSDITRQYQRMDFYLPYLVDELTKAGLTDQDITFLCALGAHNPQTQEEKDAVLGEALKGRFTLQEHDCRDEKNLVHLGFSRHGTPIALNRLAVECDHLILTGAIGYHDMAGYGGGRKSLLPGIASYEGVAANHLQVFSKEVGQGLHPCCKMGNVSGNPMHEDMLDACELLPPAFVFNVVLDVAGEYCGAFAGRWDLVFEKGAARCDEACSMPISQKADVVIASCGGYPKDMNLYQASKGFAACAEAVKEGGTIILAAACENGMGAEDSVKIIGDFKSHPERERAMRSRFVPEAYSGYYICELAQKYRLILVTDYPNAEELERSGMAVCRRLDEALKLVFEKSQCEDKEPESPEQLTYVIPHAVSLLPKLC